MGDTEILHMPFGDMESYAEMARTLTEADPRRFPIDAAAVSGDNMLRQEVRLKLPSGWKVRLPPSFTAKSDFGTYTVRYEQKDRDLIFTRNFIGARGTLPPEKMTELIAWLEQIGADDTKYVVVDR